MKIDKENVPFSEVKREYIKFSKQCYQVLALVRLPKSFPCEWDQHTSDYTQCGKPANWAHVALLFDKPKLQVVCSEHINAGYWKE